jgi:hypothetical protein
MYLIGTPKNEKGRTNPPILVQQKNIEPSLFIPRHKHPNPITPQLKMHTRVFHISDAVHPKVGRALAKENRPDGDPRCWCLSIGEWEINFAHVVEETRDGEYVKGAEGTLGACALGVVVVPMDGEDRDADVEI